MYGAFSNILKELKETQSTDHNKEKSPAGLIISSEVRGIITFHNLHEAQLR